MADRTRVKHLARDVGVWKATGYRYLHEAIDAVADHARTLREVIAQAIREAHDHLHSTGH